MTTFHAGDRVAVSSLLFPLGGSATVTDPTNGVELHSITARYDEDGTEWIFRPEELEHCTDGTEQFRNSDEGDITDAGHRPVQ